jgi:hypothetical protein
MVLCDAIDAISDIVDLVPACAEASAGRPARGIVVRGDT